jgi:hypothetical protein
MKRPPLFLLGAGFNRGAEELAGPIIGESIYIGKYQIRCGYPLLNDLWQLCFPEERAEIGGSIEYRFQRALEQNNWEPFKRLYFELMKADYYLVPALLQNDTNCYATFFRDFEGSSFLTFNYDSLPEAFLFRSGKWYPHDGYGLPVEAELTPYGQDDFEVSPSSSLVLHLHGSLCVYTCEFELVPSKGMSLIQQRKSPKFYFDPHSITSLFTPYGRVGFDAFAYEEIELRVIAPIPDKAGELKKQFVSAMYSKVKELVSDTSTLVSIGYGFNRFDKESYGPLLDALSRNHSATGVIVSPDAPDIRRRLSLEYRGIKWLGFVGTFRRWVDSDYPGVGR